MVLLLFDGEAARFGAARTGCANADKTAAVLSKVRRVAVMGFPWLRLDRAIMTYAIAGMVYVKRLPAGSLLLF